MSDPVTNIQIEDVLSSIRRLVSEETGTHPRPGPARQPPKDNRLVLTPALRVADENVDRAKPEMPQRDADEQSAADTPWSDPDATLYSVAGATVPDDDASDAPQTDHDPSAEAQAHRGDDELDDRASDADEADHDSGAQQDDLESATAPGADETDAGPQDDSEEAAVVSEDQSTALDADDGSETDEGHLHSEQQGDFDDLTPLTAKIEALEMAIGETKDQWEPDGAAGDDYAGTSGRTLQWMDHDSDDESDDQDAPATVEQSSDAAPQAVFGDDSDLDFLADDDDSELDFLTSEDSVMDEESLRELVAEIVREELQGALGERITRNVRKLVRREIHRALTAQELD